jgi:ABC-type oligopeptide transport system substrate-binding subunit
MKQHIRTLVVVSGLLIAMSAAAPAFAQKQGGILKLSHFDSPASMSILEESTRAALQPAMGIFNNLVMYKQDVPQTSLRSIVPDLATGWSWNEDGTELTFPLRQGVKWHDGKPFTAKDVKCTSDLLTGTASEKLRLNPRKSWYANLQALTTNGDYEVTFHLKRPQPSLLDRHRPIQVRRVQTERTDYGDPKPRLLETGTTLSRRHRIYDHQRDRHAQPGVLRREIRRDLALWRDDPDFEGLQEPGAARDL